MAIIGFQPHKEVEKIAKSLNFEISLLKDIIDLKEAKEILAKIEKLNWSYFLYENTLLAVNALKLLGLRYNINSLDKVRLFGRFYSIRENVIIDVGHNLLSAKACVEALKSRYNSKDRVILVYNSFRDKDFKSILNLFKSHIKRVEIIPINGARVVDIDILKDELKKASIEFRIFRGINSRDNYLVFGSFLVVESFIKKYLL
jgi:dihydrofolate synthase/folylpolyglutamate synthase